MEGSIRKKESFLRGKTHRTYDLRKIFREIIFRNINIRNWTENRSEDVLAANTRSQARNTTTNVYTCEASSDITGNLWETALEFQ
jgi:hypothetical protein